MYKIAMLALLLTSLAEMSSAQIPAPNETIKIADCSVPASGNEPAETIQIYRTGTDRNDKSAISIVVPVQGQPHSFSADTLAWSPDNTTLTLSYARFVFLSIHNGNRDDNTTGVALGGTPQTMSCTANL